MAHTNTHMTRAQWDVLNEATSMAKTMCMSTIADIKRIHCDPSMYEGWLENAKKAQKTLVDLAVAIPHNVWFADYYQEVA